MGKWERERESGPVGSVEGGIQVGAMERRWRWYYGKIVNFGCFALARKSYLKDVMKIWARWAIRWDRIGLDWTEWYLESFGGESGRKIVLLFHFGVIEIFRFVGPLTIPLSFSYHLTFHSFYNYAIVPRQIHWVSSFFSIFNYLLVGQWVCTQILPGL